MTRLYVDTNIIIDIVRDRRSGTGRDTAAAALSVFSRAESGDFELVISEWTWEELEGELDESEMEIAEELFDRAGSQIVDQPYTAEDKKRAKEIDTHWHDALHGILAEKADADHIVTQNVDDFRMLTGFDPVPPSYL
ncbi:MAG: type II toxin-antitoxin system VapC family toxin [Candidatus Nanohaloarchaea archaeon]